MGCWIARKSFQRIIVDMVVWDMGYLDDMKMNNITNNESHNNYLAASCEYKYGIRMILPLLALSVSFCMIVLDERINWVSKSGSV
jgi:hypothetical protein